MIDKLLHIKKIRVGIAERELNKAKEKLVELEQELLKVKQDLEDHIKFRKKKENELYDEIIGHQVERETLEKIKQKVARMKHQDVDYLEAIETVKKNIEQAKEHIVECKKKLVQAEKNEQKYEELNEQVKKEAALAQQMAEDNELDEFKVKVLSA